ncbi:hypothetical protein AVEN_88051-1 [Araneus ventricosus]|uniref:Uncharacterized protein n=1 Tax=Araneus ventricosus TaxID=182803 RepID=A0A4Y2N9L5_ARAVE|nr:hypothetical protein AVEN_88051-1 [Araneus ventricosus]
MTEVYEKENFIVPNFVDRGKDGIVSANAAQHLDRLEAICKFAFQQFSASGGSNTTVRLSTKKTMKQYLVEEFGERILGYGDFQEWTPRSPDLTPTDFFLWGIPQTAGV